MGPDTSWHTRIMDQEARTVVGAGILVSPRRIVTSAHVVAAALGISHGTETLPGGHVTIDFPQSSDDQLHAARVVVDGWLPGGADLAMLEVLGPEPAVTPAPLQLAGKQGRRTVSVHGYLPGHDAGVWAHARLSGHGGPQRESVQLDVLTGTGQRVLQGFSGAAVWDDENEAVIGCVVAGEQADQDRTAWMIPLEVIVAYWPDLHGLVMRQPFPVGLQLAGSRDLSLMSANDRERLASMLLGLRGISDPATRALFIEGIQRRFAGRLEVPRTDSGPLDTLALVDACLEHPGALHELVEQLRAYHHTEPEQRLVEEIATLAETADPAPLLTVAQRNALYRQLGVLAETVTADVVLSFYRAASGPLQTAAVNPFDLPSVIRRLEAVTSDPDGLPPLITFLEELSKRLPQARSDGLRTWVDDFAGREGTPRHLISRLRLSSPPTRYASRRNLATGYLSTELSPDGADDLRYHCRITLRYRERDEHLLSGRVLYDSRESLTIPEIPALFDSVLSGVWDATTVEIDDLVIEFLLPLGLLGQAVDQWQVDAGAFAHPVSLEYKVVVRSRDRLSLRRGYAQWREKTRQLRSGHAAVRWADPHDIGDASRLFGEIVSGGAQCLALVRPPQLPLRLGSDAVSIGLRTGVPAIIWCRDEAYAEAFATRLRAQIEEHGVERLPELVQEQRTNSARIADRVGSNITLMWDLADEPTAPVHFYRAPAT